LKGAAYEFKYVIDGAFVNESKQTLSNGTGASENSVLRVKSLNILICYTETFPLIKDVVHILQRKIIKIKLKYVFYVDFKIIFGNGFGSLDNCNLSCSNDCCKYVHRQKYG
jgi:hypothetical protein